MLNALKTRKDSIKINYRNDIIKDVISFDAQGEGVLGVMIEFRSVETGIGLSERRLQVAFFQTDTSINTLLLCCRSSE